MSTKQMQSTTFGRDALTICAVTAAILMIPYFGMQVSNEVNWTLIDFVVMGILIAGTGAFITLAYRSIRTNTNRLIIVAIILALFLYIWAELAVGIFTNIGS